MIKPNEVKESVISQDLIFLDENSKQKNDVIALISNKAKEFGYINDTKKFYTAVQNRENTVPTAIGYQIAIPHGKSDVVDKPFIAFLRTSEAFQWSKESDELVRLIFLIGVPEKSEGKVHLKLISEISKKLLDDEFRNQLLIQDSKEKVFNQLNSIKI